VSLEPRSEDLLTMCGLTSRKLPPGGPGLSGLVHEEAHASISYHTSPSFKDIEARGPNRLLIQPIPPVDYPVRKKCLQQSAVHLSNNHGCKRHPRGFHVLS